jgi:hypothetical protein
MKQFVVTITLENGKTICDPVSVYVGPGDIVRWRCDDGELAVDFAGDTPFTSAEVWVAGPGQLTSEAIVRSDLSSGTVFQPTISIAGTVVAASLGDIIFL